MLVLVQALDRPRWSDLPVSRLRVVFAVVTTILITPTAVRASSVTDSIANGDEESGLRGRPVVVEAPAALGYDLGEGYPAADDPGRPDAARTYTGYTGCGPRV